MIMNTIRFTLIHLYVSHYLNAQYIIFLVQQYGDLHLNIFIYIIYTYIWSQGDLPPQCVFGSLFGRRPLQMPGGKRGEAFLPVLKAL